MLSILIPVYECDVRVLVQTLHFQCHLQQIDFEIICFDDGSAEAIRLLNREIRSLEGVHYEELTQNIGRSAIRNSLAAAARYDYLLFMDNDSRVISENYIQNYIRHLSPQHLICGGRCYTPAPPADSQCYLHWWYGINREQSSAASRNLHPWHGFMTNNFVAPKSLFQHLHFDESITRYGHEDTLFGRELKIREIPILHIDNPLEHIGLEDTDTFLRKAHTAIRNLYALSLRYPDLDTRLLQVFRKVKQAGLSVLLLNVLHGVQPILLNNLKSKRPSLRALDAYKLGLLLWEEKLKGTKNPVAK